MYKKKYFTSLTVVLLSKKVFFLVDVLTVKMAVYLQQISGEGSVNSFLSLSRNYFSLNQRQDKEYVCFGKYNTSLIPRVCIYDFVGFNLRL